MLLANLYRAQGDYEKATQTLEQNSQVDADDPDIVQLRFDLALEQKEFQTAESLQQIIRTENLDQCEGNLAAARLEMVKGNDQQALRRLDEFLALNPLLSFSYFLKSQVQRQMGNEEDAIESAKKAVGMDPQNASYMRQVASLFFTRNTALGNKVTLEQQAEAERAVGMAMRLNPSDPQLQGVYSEINGDQLRLKAVLGEREDELWTGLKQLDITGSDPTAMVDQAYRQLNDGAS